MQIYKKKIAFFKLRESIIAGSFFLLLFLLNSCYKKQDTILMVIVKKTSGEVVEGALVELKAEPTTFGDNIVTINMKNTTNELGIANFNFNEYYNSGQTGVVVLKIKAKHFGLYGEDVVTVEQEVTTEKVVIIN